MNILHTENLSIGYPGQKECLASGLNLTMNKGVTALIGRNGAGKSTLIKTLCGNIKPMEGRILINGKELSQHSKKELSHLIAVVSTENNNAGGLKLHELVSLGRIPYTGITGRLTSEDRDIVAQAIENVGISHKKDRFVSELSDGERQKGMIARGLAQQTPIIFMDEPFSFLDVASRLELLSLIRRLASEERKSILFSTHEVTEALKGIDRLWAFTTDGIREGETAELIKNGHIDRLFSNDKIKFDRNNKEFIYNI